MSVSSTVSLHYERGSRPFASLRKSVTNALEWHDVFLMYLRIRRWIFLLRMFDGLNKS